MSRRKSIGESVKISIGIFAGILLISAVLWVLGGLWWNGAFNRLDVREISAYQSPDGSYTLVFQQLGDPQWPFGSTDVRLVLKDSNQNKIESADFSIQDDGANASAGNIRSIEWNDGSVVIILQASEMEDKEIIIPFG